MSIQKTPGGEGGGGLPSSSPASVGRTAHQQDSRLRNAAKIARAASASTTPSPSVVGRVSAASQSQQDWSEYKYHPEEHLPVTRHVQDWGHYTPHPDEKRFPGHKEPHGYKEPERNAGGKSAQTSVWPANADVLPSVESWEEGGEYKGMPPPQSAPPPSSSNE